MILVTSQTDTDTHILQYSVILVTVDTMTLLLLSLTLTHSNISWYWSVWTQWHSSSWYWHSHTDTPIFHDTGHCGHNDTHPAVIDSHTLQYFMVLITVDTLLKMSLTLTHFNILWYWSLWTQWNSSSWYWHSHTPIFSDTGNSGHSNTHPAVIETHTLYLIFRDTVDPVTLIQLILILTHSNMAQWYLLVRLPCLIWIGLVTLIWSVSIRWIFNAIKIVIRDRWQLIRWAHGKRLKWIWKNISIKIYSEQCKILVSLIRH